MVQTDSKIGGASPCFIVRNVPATLAFYRDKLGFEISYQGPEPDDIFFGIVQRGRAMIMFKAIGSEPVPEIRKPAVGTVLLYQASEPVAPMPITVGAANLEALEGELAEGDGVVGHRVQKDGARLKSVQNVALPHPRFRGTSSC